MRPTSSSNLVPVFATGLAALIHVVGIAVAVLYVQQQPLAAVLAPKGAKDTSERASTAPEPPPEPPLPPTDLTPPDLLLGEADGTGLSINSSHAEGIQKAPKQLIDQAALTRDAERQSNASRTPSQSPALQALASPHQPQAFRPPAQELLRTPAPIGRKAKAADAPADGKDDQTRPIELARAEQATPGPQIPDQAPKPPNANSGMQAGRPLEQSDRDSDLFASEFSMEFERGRVKARKGREFKFSRPRENLAAIVDTAVISFPAVCKLRVEIDDRGYVRKVTVERSTGSSAIDRVFELATYSSWFEPPTDSTGKPMADAFTFGILLE